MQVWDKLYMSSNISQDRNQAIARIASGRCPGTWFVIAISQMQDGELEILPAKLIKASCGLTENHKNKSSPGK